VWHCERSCKSTVRQQEQGCIGSSNCKRSQSRREVQGCKRTSEQVAGGTAELLLLSSHPQHLPSAIAAAVSCNTWYAQLPCAGAGPREAVWRRRQLHLVHAAVLQPLPPNHGHLLQQPVLDRLLAGLQSRKQGVGAGLVYTAVENACMLLGPYGTRCCDIPAPTAYSHQQI
jgi:hypothetical protein